MSQRHLTLFIPGLLGRAEFKQTPGVFDGLSLQDLERLLVRSVKYQQPEKRVAGQLFALFDTDANADKLPVAAVTRLLDQKTQNNGYCLRADPVHVKPDRDRIVMFGNQALNIRLDEAEQLAAEFNALFADDGLVLYAPTSHRWYLSVSDTPEIKTIPLDDVIGDDIHRHMPSGPQAMQWHQSLNEVQMLFHASSVNKARQARGEPEINSLWFWGGGELPAVTQPKWQHVWANNVIAKGLAKHCGVAYDPMPPTMSDWLEQADEAGNHLLVIDGAQTAMQFSDIATWRDFIQMINDDWARPIITVLKKGDVASVDIISDRTLFSAKAKYLKRWWKRPHPFARIVE
jgi:hypothetical protein